MDPTRGHFADDPRGNGHAGLSRAFQKWGFGRTAEARTDETGMRTAWRAPRVNCPRVLLLSGSSVVPAPIDGSLIDQGRRGLMNASSTVPRKVPLAKRIRTPRLI